MATVQPSRSPWRKAALRVAGLVLLLLLLWTADLGTVWRTWQTTHWPLLILALGMSLPMLFLKTARWWIVLRGQGITYALFDSYLATWAGILAGVITPGRLGEFTRALYISWECNVATSHAVASVLVDRLFDMAALVLVGSIALSSLIGSPLPAIITSSGMILFGMILTQDKALILVFSNHRWLRYLSTLAWPGKKWVWDICRWLLEIPDRTVFSAILLTGAAYVTYFLQCFLIAAAIELDISFATTSYSVALGSMAALLPFSIAGLGTREAAIIAYLNTAGISAETALSFSLLVFAVFYLGGGLFGAVAWWIKPLNAVSKHPQNTSRPR